MGEPMSSKKFGGIIRSFGIKPTLLQHVNSGSDCPLSSWSNKDTAASLCELTIGRLTIGRAMSVRKKRVPPSTGA